MNQKFQPMLVLANSARMLAQSAHKEGFRPLAIDLWSDQDTRLFAKDLLKIASFSGQNLRPVVAGFASKFPGAYAVYGSGFEQYPESLKILDDCLTLLGNSPTVFTQLQNKQFFFSLLKKLGIPYPEISFHRPYQKGNWLIKPVRGQGGVGIRRYCHNDKIDALAYWQKYQEGEPHSVLFLADGKRSQVIGFNRQWPVCLGEQQAFVFSGIMNGTDLPDKVKAQMSNWLDKLVPEFSLVGLNSLDFIQFGQTSYVLEINPRPSASMELYDAALFTRHIMACQGALLDDIPAQSGYSGYQIVYAEQETRIPEQYQWPSGSQDLPHPGSIIGAGQPICSIITHTQEPRSIQTLLLEQQNFIINELRRFQSHGK